MTGIRGREFGRTGNNCSPRRRRHLRIRSDIHFPCFSFILGNRSESFHSATILWANSKKKIGLIPHLYHKWKEISHWDSRRHFLACSASADINNLWSNANLISPFYACLSLTFSLFSSFLASSGNWNFSTLGKLEHIDRDASFYHHRPMLQASIDMHFPFTWG